jgi:hypothetical protein
LIWAEQRLSIAKNSVFLSASFRNRPAMKVRAIQFSLHEVQRTQRTEAPKGDASLRKLPSRTNQSATPWVSWPLSWALDSRTCWGSNDEHIDD